jgi:hypothetical protein
MPRLTTAAAARQLGIFRTTLYKFNSPCYECSLTHYRFYRIA